MFRSDRSSDHWVAVGLVALGVLFRVLPHPQNFTPTTAIALFAGVVLPRRLALVVPLFLMVISDLWIGYHDLYWLVWTSFVMVGSMGIYLREKLGWGSLALASLSGSLFFFIVTNLGVFLFQDMYPKNGAGLAECFTLAVPFFKHSLISDLIFSFSLFGLYSLARRGTQTISVRLK